MKQWINWLAALAFVVGVTTACADNPKPAEGAAPAKAAMAATYYVCPACHTMAMEAGKCEKCGKEMKPMHLVAVKGEDAYFCTCGAACKCVAKGDDMSKCSCGKKTVKVDIKGKYVCPACCNVVADKPGTCACGKELKKVQ